MCHALIWVFSEGFKSPLSFSNDCWPFNTPWKYESGTYHFISAPTEFAPFEISNYDIRPLFLYVGLGALLAFILGQSALAKWIGASLGLLLIVLVAASVFGK